MKTKGALVKLSSYFAPEDDSREWLKSPRLRSSWHRFFFSLLGLLTLNVLVTLTPLSEYFIKPPAEWNKA